MLTVEVYSIAMYSMTSFSREEPILPSLLSIYTDPWLFVFRKPRSCIPQLECTEDDGKIRNGARSSLLSNLVLPYSEPGHRSHGSFKFDQVAKKNVKSWTSRYSYNFIQTTVCYEDDISTTAILQPNSDYFTVFQHY